MKKKKAIEKFYQWSNDLKDVGVGSVATTKDDRKVPVHQIAHGAAVGLTLAAGILDGSLDFADEDIPETVIKVALDWERLTDSLTFDEGADHE